MWNYLESSSNINPKDDTESMRVLVSCDSLSIAPGRSLNITNTAHEIITSRGADDFWTPKRRSTPHRINSRDGNHLRYFTKTTPAEWDHYRKRSLPPAGGDPDRPPGVTRLVKCEAAGCRSQRALRSLGMHASTNLTSPLTCFADYLVFSPAD